MAPEQPVPQAGASGPLAGVRVLELGQMVAGPFAARLLADFGAEVIKVEPPGTGDPLRGWRTVESGTSLWWYAQARNKKCITLDLRQPEGSRLAAALAAQVDILVENFRPGNLERWGLAPETLWQTNPGLIIVRISGFGQDGPYRDRPGFGSTAESLGGLRHITGYPDRPPVRLNLSLGDDLAGLWAVGAALAALHHRRETGRGQVVDMALYEACFGLSESMVPEYSRQGCVREREGNRVPGVAPQGTYPCGDGQYAIIGGNSDAIFPRLMRAIGREDLAADPALRTGPGRAAAEETLDEAIAAWTSQHTLAAVLEILQAADVPVAPIYSIANIFADPHYAARRMLEEVEVPGLGRLHLPGVVPKFSATPGSTRWAGPPLGAHNDEVLGGMLGLSAEEMAQLRLKKVI